MCSICRYIVAERQWQMFISQEISLVRALFPRDSEILQLSDFVQNGSCSDFSCAPRLQCTHSPTNNRDLFFRSSSTDIVNVDYNRLIVYITANFEFNASELLNKIGDFGLMQKIPYQSNSTYQTRKMSKAIIMKKKK